ncbi:13901_t:CDS:2, partial [Racocetra fulgida]
MEYASEGNLKDYKNFQTHKWSDKFVLLVDITCCLRKLHEKGYVQPKIKEINELLDHWNLILNYGPKYPEYKRGGYASLDDNPFKYYKVEDAHDARLNAIEERRIAENKFSHYGSEFEEYKTKTAELSVGKNGIDLRCGYEIALVIRIIMLNLE